jgi:uncharacterized membrane protein
LLHLINPNYHAILIHFPLALLYAGLAMEIASLFVSKGGVQTAGRWMLLIGALSAAPAVTSGVYGLKYALGHGADAGSWIELKQNAALSPHQWDLLDGHILKGAVGSAIALAVAVTWIAASDRWRANLRWPLLLASAGWYGGEMVYRTGISVYSPRPAKAQADQEQQPGRFDYVVSPPDAHAVGAGVIAALSALGLGLAIRRVTQPPAESAESSCRAGLVGLWIAIVLAAIVTGILGLYVGSLLSWQGLSEAFHPKAGDSIEPRVIAHLLLAAAIILMALAMTIFLWRRPQSRRAAMVLVLALGLIVAAQIWLGILLMCDSSGGALTHFQTAQEAAE